METTINIVKDLEKLEISPSVESLRKLLTLTRSAKQGLPQRSHSLCLVNLLDKFN